MNVRSIPWQVWAALAPAVIILGLQWWTGGRRRVPVLGTGPVSALREQDAPQGARLVIETRQSGDLEQAADGISRAIGGWPDVIVFGLAGPADAVLTQLARLCREAENAAAVPIAVGPAAMDEQQRARFRALCDGGPLRVCVDGTGEVVDTRKALAHGIADGLRRHEALRASTQVRR